MIKENQWEELFNTFDEHSDAQVYLTDVLSCSSHFLRNLCIDEDAKSPVRGFKEFLKKEIKEKSNNNDNESVEFVDTVVDAFILDVMFSLFATYAASFLFHGDQDAIASFSERVGGGKLVQTKRENKNLCQSVVNNMVGGVKFGEKVF